MAANAVDLSTDRIDSGGVERTAINAHKIDTRHHRVLVIHIHKLTADMAESICEDDSSDSDKASPDSSTDAHSYRIHVVL